MNAGVTLDRQDFQRSQRRNSPDLRTSHATFDPPRVSLLGGSSVVGIPGSVRSAFDATVRLIKRCHPRPDEHVTAATDGFPRQPRAVTDGGSLPGLASRWRALGLAIF